MRALMLSFSPANGWRRRNFVPTRLPVLSFFVSLRLGVFISSGMDVRRGDQLNEQWHLRLPSGFRCLSLSKRGSGFVCQCTDMLKSFLSFSLSFFGVNVFVLLSWQCFLFRPLKDLWKAGGGDRLRMLSVLQHNRTHNPRYKTHGTTYRSYIEHIACGTTYTEHTICDTTRLNIDYVEQTQNIQSMKITQNSWCSRQNIEQQFGSKHTKHTQSMVEHTQRIHRTYSPWQNLGHSWWNMQKHSFQEVDGGDHESDEQKTAASRHAFINIYE